MISVISAVVTTRLAAVASARIPTVSWPIRPVVMRRMMLGLGISCLMIEVGMQTGVLVTSLRILMRVVVSDIPVLSLMGKIRVVVGMPTTVPISIYSLNRTSQGGDQGNSGEC